MFRRLDENSGTKLRLSIDGQEFDVPSGISVAAAMLLCGSVKTRDTPVSASPRLPYCMMGVCFDCLVTIDGLANQQACQVEVETGMSVEYQRGAAELPWPE